MHDMFRQLGAGSFAAISVDDARGSVVVKQVHDWRDGDKLRAEHELLERAYVRCLDEPAPLFALPRPLGADDGERESERFRGTGLGPRALYAMSRVWPLPPAFAARVRRGHFPPPHGDDDRQPVPPAPFIARLYLGRERAPGRAKAFYNAANFPLDAAAVRALFGPEPAAAVARGIGDMLGRLNFLAETDARDVEFVACGSETDPWRPEPGFACIDFNQCRPLDLADVEGAAAAVVSAVRANDPYFPLQPSAEWDAFSEGYAAAARLPGAAGSAPRVADAVLSQLKHGAGS